MYVKLVTIFTLLIVSVVAFFVSIYFHWESVYKDSLYPNIYINEISVGARNINEVKDMFKLDQYKLENTHITIIYDKAMIATFSASTIGLKSNIEEIADKAYRLGRSENIVKNMYDKFTLVLGTNDYSYKSGLTYDSNPFKEFIAQVEASYTIEPTNALFQFEEGKVTAFSEEKPGLRIRSDEFIENINNVINEFDETIENKFVTLNHEIVQPDITLSQSNDFGIEELIGVGVSDYSGSSNERKHNVVLGMSKFNGVLIPAGEELSFNKTIGTISSSTGYKSAFVIQNGRTVLGDGGGVCQVSTTVFRAGLNTGLPIISRNAHAYRVSYYENDSPPGLDATIYIPTVDLKIKNDTGGAILLQSSVDEETNIATIKVYGKNDGRRVELTEPVIHSQIAPPEALYQDDPTLARGVTRQVEYAAWGARVSFDYKVIRDDETVFEKTFISNYRPWRPVYLVGVKD